jgi:hypothetical protein
MHFFTLHLTPLHTRTYNQRDPASEKILGEIFGFTLGAFYRCSRIFYDCRSNDEMKLTETQWQTIGVLWRKRPATMRDIRE